MGRGQKRAVAASLGTAQRQAQLQTLPLIKKPIEQIGKSIKVPGSFWEGSTLSHSPSHVPAYIDKPPHVTVLGVTTAHSHHPMSQHIDKPPHVTVGVACA